MFLLFVQKKGAFMKKIIGTLTILAFSTTLACVMNKTAYIYHKSFPRTATWERWSNEQAQRRCSCKACASESCRS